MALWPLTADFFLQTQGAIPRVQVYRTRDANQGRQLVVDVLNTAVADYLAPNSLPPQRYGVQRWQVTQFRTTPPAVRITLTLDNSSPDWQVAALGQGGIALLPVGVPASQIPSPPTTVVLPVIHPAPAAPQPPAAQPMPAMAASPQASGQRSAMPGREQIIVMLDPGHGGADPGAVGIGGLQEKLVVINVAHYAAEVLRSQGITVQMTRQGDETVDLQPRVEIAEAAGATVFVSIHANAVNMQRPEVNGLETYYFSESGHVLAEILHRRVISTMAMNNRGVKQARFFVLRRTSMPASLIEIGFVTGAADAPKLRDPAWQAQMGQAIAAGILDYLHQTR
jgi:N-acetylmuramoyl-L-alanine amidase